MAYDLLAHTYYMPTVDSTGLRIFAVSAPFQFRIKSISYYTFSGTCSLRLKIGTTVVGGSTVTAIITRQTTLCGSPNVVNPNDTIFIEILSYTVPEDVYVQISIERL